jgi:hypothetical protein
MQTFFKTKQIKVGKCAKGVYDALQSEFEARHNNGKNTFTLDIGLFVTTNTTIPKVEFKLNFGEMPEGILNEEQALDKLAEWLSRASVAIRKRKASRKTIQFYT